MADTRDADAVLDTSRVQDAPDGTGSPEVRTEALLDQEEEQSFPASDAHGDWAGPPSWLSDGQPAAGATAAGGGPTAGRRGHRSDDGSRSTLQVAGIPVRMNATLLVIAGVLAWSFWLRYSAIASRGAHCS